MGSALRSNGARPFQASGPQPVPDPVFLEAQGQQLLGDDVPRLRRRHHGLDVPLSPEVQQPGGPQQRSPVQREEQAVPGAPGAPAGAPDALQERRHGRRVVHLDDAIEVTDVDPQLQRGGRDDDTVASLGERLLRAAALVDRQRRVRQVRGHAALPQRGADLLDELPGVAEDSRFSPRCSVAITVAALLTEPT